EICDAMQDRTATLWPEVGPGREGRPGGIHGEVYLVLAPAGDVAEKGAVDWGSVAEGLRRRDPFAPDPVPGVDRDTGNVDTRACDIRCRHNAPVARRRVCCAV